MRARALFLADGSSDVPLGEHAAALARDHGVRLEVVTPPFERMNPPPGRTVEARLRSILTFDSSFDAVLVHRDAEGQQAEQRLREVESAMIATGVTLPWAVIVPIRMTEAWLLLDEPAIRLVAGRPTGTEPLGLPPCHRLESIPDAKAVLADALERASGRSGRRLRQFQRDFSYHRRALLERLDRAGDVRQLSGWRAFEAGIAQMAADLRSRVAEADVDRAPPPLNDA